MTARTTTARTTTARMGRTALHVALVLLMAGFAACTPLDNVMVAVFGRSMRDQASLDPYENTRPAPEGSVPFSTGNLTSGPGQLNTGQPVLHDYSIPPMTPTDVIQQADFIMELENPVPATPESLARGEELYNRYCAVCHGETGVGADAYIADVHPVLPAYNLSGPVVQAYPDGYIYAMMRVGRGLMPPYGHAISHFDRWNVVNYIRQLQEEAGAGAAGAGAD